MQPLEGRSLLLLPLNKQGALHLNLHTNTTVAAAFSENEVVMVRVLSAPKNNIIRIAAKGVVMQVKALSSVEMQEGTFLVMRVHLTADTVVLSPYHQHVPAQFPHEDVFTQLNIPQSDLTASLITFFLENEQPLESKQLSKLLTELSIFHPHEKKAAFVAALLASRGITLSPELIAHYLQGVFGIPAPQQFPHTLYDDDLFRLVNHIKAARNHWVVFPFEKHIKVEWKGSVAFLLDMYDTCCLECCVRVHSDEKNESWIFTLKDNECLFADEGASPLSAQQEQEFTHLLAGCLTAAGALSYTVRPASGDKLHNSLASIDISV